MSIPNNLNSLTALQAHMIELDNRLVLKDISLTQPRLHNTRCEAQAYKIHLCNSLKYLDLKLYLVIYTDKDLSQLPATERLPYYHEYNATVACHNIFPELASDAFLNWFINHISTIYGENNLNIWIAGLPDLKPTLPSERAAPLGQEMISPDKGRTVAEITDKLLKKHIYKSKHFLRKPPAIAFDLEIIEAARAAGVERVEAHEDEDKKLYSVDLDRFVKSSIVIDRGAGPQLALPLEYWTVKDNKQLGLC